MVNIGFFYDFDLTLSEEFQQYPLFRRFMKNLNARYGIEKPEQYWTVCGDAHLKIAWLQQFAMDCRIGVFPDMTNQRIQEEFAPLIQLAPGVDEWFERINEFGKSLDLDISHHVISSGAVPFVEGTSIRRHLQSVVAGEFIENGFRIDGVKDVASAFEKVEALKRITKGGDLMVDMPIGEYPINHRRTFVFGDGQTDRNMFRYDREAGGRPIGVYEKGNRRAYDKTVATLEGDVVAILPRDYTAGSHIDVNVRSMLRDMADNECSMDPDLVQRLHMDQIVSPAIRHVVGKHYDACGYCQRRREQVLVFP